MERSPERSGPGKRLCWAVRGARAYYRVDGKDGSTRLAVSLTPQALGQFEQMFPTSEVRGR